MQSAKIILLPSAKNNMAEVHYRPARYNVGALRRIYYFMRERRKPVVGEASCLVSKKDKGGICVCAIRPRLLSEYKPWSFISDMEGEEAFINMSLADEQCCPYPA